MLGFVATAVSVALFAVPAYHEPAEYFRLRDLQIVESSGVASSSKEAELFFTHNDSGDVPRFFAVDETGCTRAAFHLEDADAIDWEDMARGPGARGRSSLWLGDIGDNNSNRSEISVYRVVEPKVRSRKRAVSPSPAPCPTVRERDVRATRFDFTYEDGPHDAEALLVHPQTGQLFVVTKILADVAEAGVYSPTDGMRASGVNVLRRVAGIPDMPSVTGGAIDYDASRLVLRNYQTAFEWSMPDGDVAGAFAAAPKRIELPAMPQGEAIAYERDGAALVTTSEGAVAAVVRLPDHP